MIYFLVKENDYCSWYWTSEGGEFLMGNHCGFVDLNCFGVRFFFMQLWDVLQAWILFGR